MPDLALQQQLNCTPRIRERVATYDTQPTSDQFANGPVGDDSPDLSQKSPIAAGQPDRCHLSVLALVPSGASRLSPFDKDGQPRQQHVSAKSSTSLVLDPSSHRVLVAESTIESKALLAFMADPTIKHIQDQPPAVPFVDIDDVERAHTFDFTIRTTAGNAIAIFAKPKDRVERPDAQERIRRLADHLPADFASEIIVVTERDFPAWLVANNTLLVSVQTDPRTYVHDAVREAAMALTDPTTINDFANALGGGATAFRPIVKLIADGILEMVEPARIDGRCMVRLASNGDVS